MRINGSQAQFNVRLEKNISIPMPDGVPLAADIFLPDAPAQFPGLLNCTPYRKDDLSAAGLRYHRHLARYGYGVARLDARGTGGSGGTATDEYSLQEHLDAVEAIDWISKQSWCNGNVGMFGSSYGGFNAIQVAMQRPPALKAICPMYFTDNRYTDDCHYKGGALQMLYDMAAYGLSMVVQNAMPPHPQYAGERWAALWEEHLQNEPWLLRWLENQTYNEQWQHGSLCEDYGAIQCAVYLFGGWRDGYVNCNLRTFQHLRCPKKVLIGPWLHTQPDTGVPGPQIDHLHEMVRFYDHWLKGIDNGIMDEPPVTIYVQYFDAPHATRKLTSGYWRHEPGWPLDRVTEQRLYFGEEGVLAATPSLDEAIEQYPYNPTVGTTFCLFSAASAYPPPADPRPDEAYSCNWVSSPLTEPVEILGHPIVKLKIAATTDIATVVVRLVDVSPDRTAALVTKGILNLTHRESHRNPSPIVPGQPYEIVVTLDATSWVFEPGHRIRIGLSGADFPNTWPSPKSYTATVYLGGNAPSRLILPVVGPQEPTLAEPQFQPPASITPLARVQTETPVWRVTRDYMAQTTEVLLQTSSQVEVEDGVKFAQGSEGQATVFEQKPSRATMRGLNWVTLNWPDRTIDTRARGQIESTETSFHVTIQLDISMDGLPYFNRRWMRSIPRHLL